MDRVDPDKRWSRPRLVQRLTYPHGGPRPKDKGLSIRHPLEFLREEGQDVQNPFSFGGGGSGHGQIARALLGTIYAYDYMGAAEYESGVVGSAVGAMFGQAKAGRLTPFSVEVEIPDFKRLTDFRRSRDARTAHRRPEQHESRTISRTLYGWARSDWVEQGLPQQVIRREAEDVNRRQPEDPGDSLRDPTGLWRSLVDEEHATEWGRWPELREWHMACGGLECTNGWVYFTDRLRAACFGLLVGGQPSDGWIDRQEAEEYSHLADQLIQELGEKQREFEQAYGPVREKIYTRLESAGRRWFYLDADRLLPKTVEEGDSQYPFRFWLNPMDQQNNRAGWYTYEQLEQWAEGRGPVVGEGA